MTDLPTQHGDVSRTLHSHAIRMRANLLVMGAYAHPMVLQIVLGGVTSGVLSEAELPVLLSYWSGRPPYSQKVKGRRDDA